MSVYMYLYTWAGNGDPTPADLKSLSFPEEVNLLTHPSLVGAIKLTSLFSTLHKGVLTSVNNILYLLSFVKRF